MLYAVRFGLYPLDTLHLPTPKTFGASSLNNSFQFVCSTIAMDWLAGFHGLHGEFAGLKTFVWNFINHAAAYKLAALLANIV